MSAAGKALLGFPEPPVMGMVHLLPLPGSPGWGGSMPEVVDRALSDAGALANGGVGGLIVENYGDVPFHPGRVPPETTASLTAVARAVVDAVDVPVGVNVLRNDGEAATAIALAAGATFIRLNVLTGVMITDQGMIQGQAHRVLRLRERLGASIAILADVFVKHGLPFPGATLEQAACDAVARGLADGLVVSGPATGSPTDPDDVARIKAAVPAVPVWVGSGATPETAAALMAVADGLIVGSALAERGEAGKPVDPARVRRFMQALER